MRRAFAGPRAGLVDCSVLSIVLSRPAVLHGHDVDPDSFAGPHPAFARGRTEVPRG
jgi:hypothetical protein